MLFKFGINLTEDDFLAYYTFYSLESVYAKKNIKKYRIRFIAFSVLLCAIVFLILGWPSGAIYAISCGLITSIYMLLHNKLIRRNIVKRVKELKKSGERNFDDVSVYEFYDDKMVEIDKFVNTELDYAAISKIFVVKNRHILLEQANSGTYILPISQITAQIDKDAFLDFLSQKCANIERY